MVASCSGYRSSHWLYNNPQHFEDQNISNVPIASILYLKQTELGYFGSGPGFGSGG